MKTPLHPDDVKTIAEVLAHADCRNQAARDALLVLRQQTEHLRRQDLDAYRALAPNIEDCLTRVRDACDPIAHGLSLPIAPAMLTALGESTSVLMLILELIGAEQRLHRDFLVRFLPDPPAPYRPGEEVPMA